MDIKKLSSKRNTLFVAGLLFLAACEYVYFRKFMFTDVGLGDVIDSRMLTLICEHWYKFFTGQDSFAYYTMFYPADDVLAYTDLLLGLGAVHTLFRLFIPNMFIAFKYAVILIHAVGMISMFILMYRQLKLHWTWSIIGTILACHCSAFATMTFHSQMVATYSIPLFLVFVTAFFMRKADDKKGQLIYGLLAIFVFDFIVYTAWYPMFFLALWALIFAIVLAVMMCIYRRDRWRDVVKYIRDRAVVIVILAVVTVASLIPFVILYLPAYGKFGARDWVYLMQFVPRVRDLINQSDRSLLWGWTFEAFDLSWELETWEGFSIPVMALLVISVIATIVIERKSLKDDDVKRFLAFALAVTIIISIVIVVRITPTFALWKIFVYDIIPGAKSVRALARWLLFLHIPAGIIIAAYGSRLSADRGLVHNLLVMVLIPVVFVSEHLVFFGYGGNYSAVEHVALVDTYAAPPEDCEVFFIDNSDDPRPQILALELATIYDIHTINGFSGQVPEGYDCFTTDDENYRDNVAKWIEDNDLTGVYCFDAGQNEWIRYN